MNEAVAAPEPADPAAEPQVDLWTSDSQRAEAQAESPVAADEPSQAAEEPEPAAAVESDLTRDESGKFTKPKTGKPRNDPAARVAAATAKEAAAKEEARLAREETNRLRAELESTRRPAEAKPAAVAGPTFPGYDAWSAAHPDQSYEDYIDARTDFRTEQRLATRDQQSRTATRVTAYQQRIEQAKAADPQYDVSIQQGSLLVDQALRQRGLQRFPQVIEEAVVDSDKAPEIVRFFATHPEEAAQLAWDLKETHVSAASVVRRLLEAQLPTGAVPGPDSASVVRPSAAKPPINRVGGTASATPATPDDLEFGPEYIRQENARERKAREASRW